MNTDIHSTSRGDRPIAAAPAMAARESAYGSLAQAVARMCATSANSRAGLASDVLVSVALLFAGAQRKDTHPPAAILTIALGLLLFTFVEYCIHRWLFHGPDNVLQRGHQKHHQEPLGYESLPFFLPPLAALGVAVTLATVSSTTFALLLTGGVAAGYAAYGLSHSIIHNARFRYFLPRHWAAAHHIHHCHSDQNFGVTTPLWDVVLKTRYISNQRRKSDREIDAM
jgi:sterol desaturase/sphingolipid hydroxylase (fatty acid hydroxylase superfamily)